MRKLSRILLVAGLFAGWGFAQQGSPEKSPTDAAQPDKEKPKGVIHIQQVEHMPEVHATQACVNHSWAASLAAVLKVENAAIPQDAWLDKYYGGDVCMEQMGTPEELIRKGEGEYILEDGRHVEVKMQYFSGMPSNVSSLLVPIMQDEVLILFVEGKAELLVGAMWDEYRSPGGERMIDLKELYLLDPLLDGEKQKVVLEAAGEDFAKISGFMKVKAVDPHPQYWPK
jgi:hypothetical protein